MKRRMVVAALAGALMFPQTALSHGPRRDDFGRNPWWKHRDQGQNRNWGNGRGHEGQWGRPHWDDRRFTRGKIKRQGDDRKSFRDCMKVDGDWKPFREWYCRKLN